jgi:putative inorganic carbon (HCO3(-)) transporter
LILFFLIGLPQFGNDKEGLAIVVLAALLLWLGGYLLGGNETRTANAIDIPVWLYLGANIVATAASHYPLQSLHGLEKVAIYISSYFLFTAVLGTSGSRRTQVLSVLVTTACGVALYGLYQYKMGVAPLATWEDPTVEFKGTRIFSTLGNPNLLAGYLIPVAPVALSLAVLALIAKKKFLALVAFSATIVLFIAIVLTGSRGGYIAFFVESAAILLIILGRIWLQTPKIRPWLILGAILLPAALFSALHFVPTFDQRLSSIFAGREHSSNSFRINVWESSLRMLKDNWWFGVGPGNQAFILAYGLYMRSGFDALGTYCVPLEIAVESGVAGLAAFVSLLFATLGRAHIAFWLEADRQSRWLAAGAAAGLIGMMSHGLVDTVFYRPQVQFIFWLLVAIVVCCHQSKSIAHKS